MEKNGDTFTDPAIPVTVEQQLDTFNTFLDGHRLGAHVLKDGYYNVTNYRKESDLECWMAVVLGAEKPDRLDGAYQLSVLLYGDRVADDIVYRVQLVRPAAWDGSKPEEVVRIFEKPLHVREPWNISGIKREEITGPKPRENEFRIMRLVPIED